MAISGNTTVPVQDLNDPRGMIYASLKRCQVAREYGRSGVAELLSLLDLVSTGLNYNDRWRDDMKIATLIESEDSRFHHIVSSVIRLLSHNRLWMRKQRLVERGTEWDEAF